MKKGGSDDEENTSQKSTPQKKKKPKGKRTLRLQKAPSAPKRFKSAFIFFTMEKHPEVRKQMEENGITDYKTPDVAKIVSEKWRNLTPAERQVWDEKARIDKERFMLEKSMYTGPWKVVSSYGESKKDPSAPKRPMSSFLAFSNGKRATVKAQNPHFNNADISKALAKMWREAPAEQKEVFIKKEAVLRAKYKKDMAAWKEKSEKEKSEASALQQSLQNRESEYRQQLGELELQNNRMLWEQNYLSTLQGTQSALDHHSHQRLDLGRPDRFDDPSSFGYLPSSVNSANIATQQALNPHAAAASTSWEDTPIPLSESLDPDNYSNSFLPAGYQHSRRSAAPQSRSNIDSRDLLAAASYRQDQANLSSYLSGSGGSTRSSFGGQYPVSNQMPPSGMMNTDLGGLSSVYNDNPATGSASHAYNNYSSALASLDQAQAAALRQSQQQFYDRRSMAGQGDHERDRSYWSGEQNITTGRQHNAETSNRQRREDSSSPLDTPKQPHHHFDQR